MTDLEKVRDIVRLFFPGADNHQEAAEAIIRKLSLSDFHDENYKIVHAGPEMTPWIRTQVEECVAGAIKMGSRAISAIEPEKLPGIRKVAVDQIEQAYLGIGKRALQDIQKAIEGRKL